MTAFLAKLWTHRKAYAHVAALVAYAVYKAVDGDLVTAGALLSGAATLAGVRLQLGAMLPEPRDLATGDILPFPGDQPRKGA